MAFVRIGSNRRIMSQPLDTNSALQQINAWTQRTNVWTPEPRARFAALFDELANETQATGNLITDVYLAALAREHGLTVISTDADFARFSNLKWLNPLSG